MALPDGRPDGRKDTTPLRVVIVDDSDSFRAALILALARDKSVQILGEAADGRSALPLVDRLHPDVVLLDIMMPRMDGIETAKSLLRDSSAAIILMSVIARYPEHRSYIDKLPRGSVDLADKPVLVGPTVEANIAALVRRMRAAVQTRQRRAEPGLVPMSPPQTAQIIAIAASTGGLEALRQVLVHLRTNFPPVVIAQHLDPLFAVRFAELLRSSLHVPVIAVDGATALRPGHLFVAAGYQHLQVRSGMVDSRPADAAELAPNADHLFYSVAHAYGETAVGVVLTGMGHDGALGLKAIRDAGGWTIAQDDSSALVNGMPRAAVELGGCREVLPLERIRERLAVLHADPRLL